MDYFGLLLLVLVFRTNKKSQRACDAQIETSTKNQNEQQKAFACFGFWDRIEEKGQRRAAKGKERQMETHTKNQNEQQKATKSIFHSYFHSFPPILDLWKVIDIKSNEKPERATRGNEKQWKAAKSYEEQQKATTNIGAGKTKTSKKKNQDEQRKAPKVQMETRL